MKPRLFYFTYSHQSPTGGQLRTYRHVDILNDAGFDAYALHLESNYRLHWFSSSTRTIDYAGFKRIYDEGRDYIVLPEDLGDGILNFPGKKVIFNKGLFNGYRALGARAPDSYPYLHRDVVAVMAVSDHNLQHLRFAYPNQCLTRVYSSIDRDLFQFSPLRDKKKQIVCVPKNEGSLLTLFHILQSRSLQKLNNLHTFEWIVLSHTAYERVAQVLRESLICIFLSIEEGLPRTPLEAMACGCLIAAHAGGPLSEILPACYQFKCGDILSIAVFIEAITSSFPSNVERWIPLTETGRRMALDVSADQERRSVLEAWERIFCRPATAERSRAPAP